MGLCSDRPFPSSSFFASTTHARRRLGLPAGCGEGAVALAIVSVFFVHVFQYCVLLKGRHNANRSRYYIAFVFPREHIPASSAAEH